MMDERKRLDGKGRCCGIKPLVYKRPQLRTYLQAMRAPELGSVAARRLLGKIMEEHANG